MQIFDDITLENLRNNFHISGLWRRFVRKTQNLDHLNDAAKVAVSDAISTSAFVKHCFKIAMIACSKSYQFSE